MKLLLTSFGASVPGIPGLHEGSDRSPFYRLPPVDMEAVGLADGFRLPYWLLLMCDKLVLDLNTFGALLEHGLPSWYDRVATLVKELHMAGWVELVDYKQLLEPHRDELKNAQLSDLGRPEQWMDQFRESYRIWREFLERARRIAGTGPPRYSSDEDRSYFAGTFT